MNADHRETVFLFMRARDQADHERESDMELGGLPMASRCLSRWIGPPVRTKGERMPMFRRKEGTRFLLFQSLMPVMPVCRTLGNTQIKGKYTRSVDPAA